MINNLNLKKIGLGFMRFNPQDISSINNIVDYSMNHNINYFESCQFYLNNQCEFIISQSLKKYPRENYFLCGKMSVFGILENNLNNFKEIFYNQLKTMNSEYFDIYLLQAVQDNNISIIYESKILPWLVQKKKEGLIKKLGFSFHGTPYCLEKMLSLGCWDCVQLQLNFYDWFISTGKINYDLAKKFNVPIIAMGPSKGGTLIRDLPSLAYKIYHQEAKFLYLKFLLSLDNILYILLGVDNLEQLQENYYYISSFDSPLNSQDWINLKNIIEIYKNEKIINCTSCNYCNKCPSKIPISKIFQTYNLILNHNLNNENFLKEMNTTFKQQPIFSCLHCGICEKWCPQHLPIQKLLQQDIFNLRL